MEKQKHKAEENTLRYGCHHSGMLFVARAHHVHSYDLERGKRYPDNSLTH